MSASISSKIVLITGANQGLGLAIAKSLSSKPDYRVLLGSRDTQRGIDAAKQLQEQGLHVEPVTIEYVKLQSFSCVSLLSPQRDHYLQIWKNVACFKALLLETCSSAALNFSRRLYCLCLSFIYRTLSSESPILC